MISVPSNRIVAVLSSLAKQDIPYRLLRNIDNELPNKLKRGKDIDVLSPWNHRGRLDHFLREIGFCRVSHPLRGDKFLYSVHPFEFYRNSTSDFFIDVHFELACRSLNQGEWIPLDRAIQARAWEECGHHLIGDVTVIGLSPACECLHLLTRCVFDKRKFDLGYLRRIEELTAILSDAQLLGVLEPVFFKFSMCLLDLLRAKSYQEIIMSHLRFMDY